MRRVQLPPAVVRAAVLTGLEGAALVVLAVVWAVLGLIGDAQDTGGAEALAGLAALFGVGLLLGARGLYRRRRWARGPVMAVQLLALLVAISSLRAARPLLAWPAAAVVVVLTAAVASQVLAPSAREALDGPA